MNAAEKHDWGSGCEARECSRYSVLDADGAKGIY